MNNIREDKIEIHDLGKETFTICKNNGDGTCNILLELPAEMEEQAKYFVDELETYINKVREEAIKKYILQDWIKGHELGEYPNYPDDFDVHNEYLRFIKEDSE